MTALAQKRMTAEEFVLWAEARPEKHWELFDGVPLMQQSQTWGHSNVKGLIYIALLLATRNLGADYFVGIDGLVVKVGGRTAFEPDVVVYKGPEMASHEIIVPKPLIVVEVLSPSTARKDLTDKLAGYFRVDDIQHYLLADPVEREIIHYHRQGAGLAPPEILSEGTLRLDPPGLEIAIGEIFR